MCVARMASAFWCFARNVQFVLRLASVVPFCACTRGREAATNTCSPWEVVYAHPCEFGIVCQCSEVLFQLPLLYFCVRGRAAIALEILINLTPHYFHAAALQFEAASEWNNFFIACARCIVYFSFRSRDWRKLPLTRSEVTAEGKR